MRRIKGIREEERRLAKERNRRREREREIRAPFPLRQFSH